MPEVGFRPGSPEGIGSLAALPVVAVDLGFAKRRRSCGVAWRDGEGGLGSGAFAFGECVEEVAGLLRGHPQAALMIEAPLSGLFAANGNPVERGAFERRGNANRYWYHGPGATTCLAAAFFLRELPTALRRGSAETRPIEIALYEGFVTFKTGATGDAADARLLLECFLGTVEREVVRVEAAEGQRVVALTDIVAGAGSGSTAPAIIVPGGIPPGGGP